MSWLKRHLPRKRSNRFTLYIASVILILLAFDIILTQIWRRIEIGHDTTRITSPLNAEGLPDYFKALNLAASAGVTAENNAAPELLKVFGTDTTKTHPGATTQWRSSALPPIGLTTEPLPPMFVGYSRWDGTQRAATTAPATAAATQSHDEEKTMLAGPWKSADHPRWKQWASEQQRGLAAAHVALQKPRFYVPYVSPAQRLTAVLMPMLASMRSLGNGLVCEANRCAGDGDWQGFRQNIEDARRLGMLQANSPILVEQLIATAIASNADHAIQAAAAHEGLTAAQSRELLKMLDSSPITSNLPRSIDIGERFMMLDSICAMSVYGSNFDPAAQDHPSNVWVVKTMLPIHFNDVLKTCNNHYDRLVEGFKAPTHPARKAAIAACTADFERERKLSTWKKLMHPQRTLVMSLLSLLMPSLERVATLEEAHTTERELARVALALRIHKAEHGAFPDTLAALAPAILATIPNDGFIDAPLIYKKEGEGYVLYSVGRNEKDDGGKSDAGNAGPLDMVVRAAK